VGAAFAWGFLAASSLVVGGIIALRFEIGTRALGLVMGFGSGVLISAVSYELVDEAFATADAGVAVALGLFAGCGTFFAGDLLIDRYGGADRKRMQATAVAAGGSALAIVLGIVLDGIPESAVIGLGLLGGEGVSAAMLAAVFLSNLPEAVAATSGLTRSGWSGRNVLLLWLGVAAVSGLASLAGYAFLDGASANAIAFVLAFAGGAILTMLADTMMPEAFEHGGRLVGVFTTLGFALAFAISALE
jgi:zinc transporter, ZIP family